MEIIRDLSPQEFECAFMEFSKRSQQYDVYTQWFETTLSSFIKRDKVKRVLTIGCGFGELESRLIPRVFANVNYISAIDPIRQFLDLFKCQFLKYPIIQLDIKNQLFETVDLSNKKYDLIILSHSCYYFVDKVAALKRIVSSLSEQGVLTIFHNVNENGGLVSLQKKLGAFCNNYCYGSNDVKKHLDMLSISYAESVLPISVNVSNYSDKLTQFFLNQYCSEQQLLEARHFFGGMSSGKWSFLTSVIYHIK